MPTSFSFYGCGGEALAHPAGVPEADTSRTPPLGCGHYHAQCRTALQKSLRGCTCSTVPSRKSKIKAAWPRFYEYLQKGREQNIHAAYLTSRRAPWYSQEERPSAPFLCTYMGRSGNGKAPIRFVWNRSQATAHNVYLMLYPKGQLRDALRNHPELEAKVFRALQRISPAQVLSEGRVYGGGLHKIEPRELAKLPARPLMESMAAHLRIEHQARLFG